MFASGTKRVSDIAEELGRSARSIYRLLEARYTESLPTLQPCKAVLLMDATYWGRKFGVVIIKDANRGGVLWYKFITKKETLADYKEGIEWLKSRGFEILAIVSDGLKGLREMFSEYRFQLCQFHQLMTIKTRLTLHPKLEASQELLGIARSLCHTDKESFIGAFVGWEKKWEAFLKERAEGADGKTHYVHKDLRSAWLSIKRNMPWLWTFYDHPELDIPNTNNGLEALNSDLKTKLALRRGLGIERRKVFIQDFLKAHNPHR